MSILSQQNIYNLGEGFGAAPYNPFPQESQQAEATPNVGWSGYKYAGPGLQVASNPTALENRTVATGEGMMNDSGDQYGPEGRRLANNQRSMLGSLAEMMAKGRKGDGTSWSQLQYTFTNSVGTRSLKQTRQDAGGNATTSGTFTPHNSATYPYTMTPAVNFNAKEMTLNGIDLNQGFGSSGEPGFDGESAIKDYNKDGTVNFDDFFILADVLNDKEGMSAPQDMSPAKSGEPYGLAALPGMTNASAVYSAGAQATLEAANDIAYDEGRA